MKFEYKLYPPDEPIPPDVIKQLQKIHLTQGMMWPSFVEYKDEEKSNFILTVAFHKKKARSWAIIFNRIFEFADKIEVSDNRYIHVYTQKSYRNKGLGRTCVSNALKYNTMLELPAPIAEGSHDFWKNKTNLYELYET
jgi:GNAT superfamily N-acetyltransferase